MMKKILLISTILSFFFLISSNKTYAACTGTIDCQAPACCPWDPPSCGTKNCFGSAYSASCPATATGPGACSVGCNSGDQQFGGSCSWSWPVCTPGSTTNQGCANGCTTNERICVCNSSGTGYTCDCNGASCSGPTSPPPTSGPGPTSPPNPTNPPGASYKDVCGYIRNNSGAPLAGVVVNTSATSGKSRSATTDSNGRFMISGYYVTGEYYTVSPPAFGPAGSGPPKSSESGWNWNYFVNPNAGTSPWADTPLGSSSYAGQRLAYGADCSGPNGSGTLCRCSFTYQPVPGCPSNLSLTCTTPTSMTASWTSGPSGVTGYYVRADSAYTNSAQCTNGNGDPVGWICTAQGDQFITKTDVNSSSGSELNSQIISVTPGVAYWVSIQSFDARGYDYRGCSIGGARTCAAASPTPTPTRTPTPTPTTIPTATPTPTPTPGTISGNFYVGDGVIGVGNNARCVATGATSLVANAGTLTLTANNGGTVYSLNTSSKDNFTSSVRASTLPFTYRATYAPGSAGPDRAYVLNCPSTGIYPVIDPTFTAGGANTNVNYFVTEYDLSNVAWWQASGASVYGSSGLTSYIPADTCDAVGPSGGCYSGMIAGNPFDTSTIKNTSGFPMIDFGSITSHDGGETHIHPAGARTLSDNGSIVGTSIPQEDFADFQALIGDLASPISTARYNSGGLTITPGSLNVFEYTGNMVIDNTDNWQVASNHSVVVFVNGNLTLIDRATDNQIIDVATGGYLAFIVSGNITVDSSVGHTLTSGVTSDPATLIPHVEGVYIADGTITVASQAPTNQDKKFVGAGTFVGWSGVQLNREFEYSGDPLSAADNNTNATETFIYRPDLVTNTPYEIRSAQVVWQEVAPGY